MAKYDVTGPDGQVYEVEAPDSATETEVLAYAQQNFGKKPGVGGPRDFISGVNRTIGGIGDALVAGYNLMLPKSQEVQPLSQGMQSVGIDLERPRSLLGMAGEYAMPGPGGLAKNVTQTALAATGGYLARQSAPDSALAEMAGAIAAPMSLTAGRPLFAEATRRTMRGSDATGIAGRVAAADAMGAPLTVGTATQGPITKVVERLSGSVPGGVTPFRQAGEKAASAIDAELTRITGGKANDVVKAGKVIEKGLFDDLTGWTARTRATRDSLYQSLDAKLAGATVPAASTVAFSQVANKGIPGAPTLSKSLFIDPQVQSHFDDLVADLSANNGAVPYEAIKRLRTEVGDMLGDPQLVGSSRRTLLKDFYSALSNDMEAAATQAGASKEFARANNYHKARIARIEDFYTALHKKVTPEDVWSAAIGDTPKSASRISAIRKALTPGEWDYVKKTIITRMGEPVASAAREGTDNFSAGTFLTNYERMKKNGTIGSIFGNGNYRKDLDKVAQYASMLKSSADVLSNPSGTAGLGLTASVYFGALGMAATQAAVGGTPAGLIGIAGGTIGNAAVARLMNNQKFIKWLAQTTKVPPVGAYDVPNSLKRLAIIANNDDQFSKDVAAFTQAVTAAR